jgi:DNA-binding transcriptional regulator YdaS (Cro superfamily)
MTLDQYLKLPGAMTLTDLANAADISKARLSQLRKKKGKRIADVPPRLALDLERATAGQIDAAAISSVIRDAREGNRDVAA